MMAPAAELGPLDVQIPHPDREDLSISGLEIANSIEFIGQFAIDLVIKGGAGIIHITRLPRMDVLRATLQFTADLLGPMVAKLDPSLVRQAMNQLKIAERYATEMLAKRQVPEDEQLDDDGASRIVQRLVENYPAHGYVIGRDEARSLKLPVRDAESYDRWDKVKNSHRMLEQKGQSVVAIMSDDDLLNMDQSDESIKEMNDETIKHNTTATAAEG